MANQQHLAILQNGVEAWNQWRQANPEITPDLSNAFLRFTCFDKIDLHDAELVKIDLYGSELRYANLRNANLHMAHLYRTDFCDADLSGAKLKGADMVKSKLINVKLQGADLRWVKLGDANLRKADMTGSRVYAISAWDVILNDTIQNDLIITRDKLDTVTVDRLEVAQFIHMLLNYKKIRDVLNSMMEKGVLILGSFDDGGLDLLHDIADRLRKKSYLPMIFDFKSPDRSDYTETIKILAGLSRFVIVDLSGHSVPQELYATIPHFHKPFVPIINNQHEPYALFRDFLKNEWVLRPVPFSNKEELFAKFSDHIIKPAEDKIIELQTKYQQIMEEPDPVFPRKSKGEKRAIVTKEKMAEIAFRDFRDSALLHARILTEENYTQKNGTIQTKKGLVAFQPGDYLVIGAENEEWPISQQHFLKAYKPLSQPDKLHTFEPYRTTQKYEAYQMPDAFEVQRTNEETLTGKAGDYLVRVGEKVWVVGCDEFERTHELC